ncbi:hypothetical protein BOTBODRAFT_640138 [Botryobasidium botryosum FD-172 SS1]|uniref:Uncharacterized protein n=1 Tax=Botryobasidium botryosum (strain FD-172 SS1) TaxID=930990 RepID=A0A067M3X8_BOTB1|nr:hypothetical protein BOTBODRAFT_640138 [Botryobasidium botryosum FD-172 SS1]
MSQDLTIDKWDKHVHSEAFDRQCDAQSKRLSSSSSGSHSSERINLWEKDDDDSSPTSVHVVPKLEAHLYYFGIRGNRHWGPKLIYRTSTDIFTPPSGPEQDHRIMQLLSVHDHDKLGRNNLWATIRDEVVKLLDNRDI